MSKYPLLTKTLMIGFLMLLLSIPLMLVLDTVRERASYRDSAAAEVARAHAGAQTISGPVLYWPYTETYTQSVPTDSKKEGEEGAMRNVRVSEKRVHLGFPSRLATRSQLNTETRLRGIFPVTVYESEHLSEGHLIWPEIKPRMPAGVIELGQPLLLMGVSDLRGLLGAPQLQVAGRSMAVGQAPAAAPLPLAAPIDPAGLNAGASLPFKLSFGLAGTGRIGWVPLADDNQVSLTSPWPHPSFGGQFLPRNRSVSAQGFQATWQVSSLSTQAQQQFAAAGGERVAQDAFSVGLEDPVDVYRLSERATKYGTLFIVLTFSAFFVLEMVKRWRIHPMQYLMVGASLVLFFLLLLSLSEQLPFAAAYALASSACIGLMSHYLRHVLGGWRPALIMGAMMTALYGVVYSILLSEDSALLMGSLLLFAVLAGIMTATRKLDWYGVMSTERSAAAPQG